jgi:hypothetical protein
VPAQSSYDYAVIRVVPRVERQEFVNAGVIVWCRDHDVLEARIALDEARLRALDPGVDLDAVRRHLQSVEVVCRGGPAAGRSAACPSANASIGWWHRAAP